MKTNYWAVLVCAAVYWLMGAVWYGLLFEKPWMAFENMTTSSDLCLAQCQHRRPWSGCRYAALDRLGWTDRLHDQHV